MFALAAAVVALIWFILDLARTGDVNWLALFLCLLAAHLAFTVALPWRRP